MNSFDLKKPFFENISTKCCILWSNGKVIYKKIDKNAKNVPSIPGGKEILSTQALTKCVCLLTLHIILMRPGLLVPWFSGHHPLCSFSSYCKLQWISNGLSLLTLCCAVMLFNIHLVHKIPPILTLWLSRLVIVHICMLAIFILDIIWLPSNGW